MPTICVTLSGNAGVCISAQKRKIWVDALYEGAGETFSPMNDALAHQVLSSEAFSNPDFICYTHCHPDHYSKELTAQAMNRWQKAKVFSPQQDLEGQILVQGQEYVVADDDVSIRFIALPHEGSQYQKVKHYGLLIQLSGCNIFLPGDCSIAAPELAKAVAGVKIHLAILDFPWLTLRRGQDFLRDIIQPEHILAYHLPFEQDDVNQYRKSAEKAKNAREKMADIRLLYNPLQTEQIII